MLEWVSSSCSRCFFFLLEVGNDAAVTLNSPRVSPYNRGLPWNVIYVFWNDKKSCSAELKMDVYKEGRWKSSENWWCVWGRSRGEFNVSGLWTWTTRDSIEILNQKSPKNQRTQNDNNRCVFFLQVKKRVFASHSFFRHYFPWSGLAFFLKSQRQNNLNTVVEKILNFFFNQCRVLSICRGSQPFDSFWGK